MCGPAWDTGKRTEKGGGGVTDGWCQRWRRKLWIRDLRRLTSWWDVRGPAGRELREKKSRVGGRRR